MNNRFRFAIIIVLCLILTALVGCVCGKSEDPYLEDRTAGWEPRLMYNAEFDVEDLDADSGELWKDILEFKPYSYGKRISAVNFKQAVFDVLKLYLGDAYREFPIPNKPESYDGKIGLINNDFAIVFEEETGNLKFFADIKNTPGLKANNLHNLLATFDLAKLNAKQLNEIGLSSRIDYIKIEEKLTTKSLLPLTAEGAYKRSVDTRDLWPPSTKIGGATGGAFKVYYSENSNAMFVVANTYIQAFDVETGKLLFMDHYSDKEDGTDESVQRDKAMGSNDSIGE